MRTWEHVGSPLVGGSAAALTPTLVGPEKGLGHRGVVVDSEVIPAAGRSCSFERQWDFRVWPSSIGL